MPTVLICGTIITYHHWILSMARQGQDKDKHEMIYTLVGLTICLASLAFGSYVVVVTNF